VTPPKENKQLADRNNNHNYQQETEVVETPKTNGYHHHNYQPVEPITFPQQNMLPPSEEPLVTPTSSSGGYSGDAAVQNVNLQEGFGKAKYTFKAESDNELSFRKVCWISQPSNNVFGSSPNHPV